MDIDRSKSPGGRLISLTVGNPVTESIFDHVALT